MRSVRMRLLVSHLVLVLLLGVVMSAAITNFVALGRGIDRVLEGNYKSISAAQQMQNGLMLDLAGYSELLIDNKPVARIRFKKGSEEFSEGLAAARLAVNEAGETEIIEQIGNRYQEHRVIVEGLSEKEVLGEQEKAEISLDESLHYSDLNTAINELIRINQNAMLRESEAAKSLVQQSAGRSILIAGASLLLAIGMTIALSRSILKPLSLLAERAESIGSGQLEDRLELNRSDELGTLANAFNVMSERLSEARQTEQRRLQRAEKMSDQAIDALYDPVIVTDAKGQIVYLNKASEGLFGPSPATPRTPIIQHVGDEMIVHAINRSLQQETVLAAEDETSLIPIKVGETNRTYRLRVTPMKDDDGHMLGSVVVLEDITHLKEIDRLKSEFIGVASHELRTPVTSLLMSVQLLDEGAVGELTPAQKGIVEVQKQDLERLHKLMQDLLDLSKLEAGTQPMRYSLVSPGDVVKAAITSTQVIAAEKGIIIETEIDPDLQLVRADRSQIERVLINLVANAIRHSPSGANVKVRATRASDQVTFSIEDRGEGIPTDYLSKVFDRFVQVPGATGGGAGLGLSIAHNIVKAHGGNIWADSKLGAGSTFHFTLPIEPSAVGEMTS
ncbi:MAG: HAMP domain-containing protein [Chlorobia bacterium]|nr:HAMP domain-containing protein [Fimbriimonadaceae bacterium]